MTNRTAGSGARAARTRLPLAALLAAAALAAGCGKSTTSVVPIPPLSRIVISVGSDTTVVADTLQIGGMLALTVTAFDLAGAPVPGAPVSWIRTVPAVATVSGGGTVTAREEGRTLLIATVSDKSDTMDILVLPAVNGWFAQTSNSFARLNDVFFHPDGRHGWVVGDGGEVLTTADAGTTWTRQPSSTLFSLHAVHFTSLTEGWAVGNAGTVIRSVDGGLTWNPVTSNASEALLDVTFASPDTGWIVGSSGVILRTFDRGTNWVKQNPSSFAFRGVSFAGTRLGWAVGDNGVIFSTEDRGVTWSFDTTVTPQSLRAVHRRSEFLAFAAGQQGVAPRTRNVTGIPVWELQNTGASNQLEGVHFPTDVTGFAVGWNGSSLILRSDDAGVTWVPQTSPLPTGLNDVFFVDELRGWAVGENGRIIHTGNGGLP